MATVDDEEHAVLDRLTFDYHQKLQGRPQSHELVRPRAWGAVGGPGGEGGGCGREATRWVLAQQLRPVTGRRPHGAVVSPRMESPAAGPRCSGPHGSVCGVCSQGKFGPGGQWAGGPSKSLSAVRGRNRLLGQELWCQAEVCSGRRGPHLAAPRKGLAGWVQPPLIRGPRPRTPTLPGARVLPSPVTLCLPHTPCQSAAAVPGPSVAHLHRQRHCAQVITK